VFGLWFIVEHIYLIAIICHHKFMDFFFFLPPRGGERPFFFFWGGGGWGRVLTCQVLFIAL
jgi:hypothetical protein